ncbi:MAG: hypothetical protein GX094_00780 [Clostridiales bacterium]|jgi:uncharacterized membrane-anchored protein|nr:hypothetical protein [Clostridiales bacterium]
MIKGRAKKDKRTKELIKRLMPGDIAVILHQDLDEVAAVHLVERKVKAVVNGAQSISGKYPNYGPKILSDAGIPIVDNIGEEAFNCIKENDYLEIDENGLRANNKFICRIKFLDKNQIEEKMADARENIWEVLRDFIDNTLNYAAREKDIVISPVMLPPIRTRMEKRHVLIVVRGRNYLEDLKAIRSYIEEVRPVIIGVDGGGDALLEFGYRPNLIIGDMDSVSDECLKSCDEIVVHAYPDGRCPGMERIRKMGLKAVEFPFAGTSEDVALILAYENKAELIVTVGSHTSMVDFLEKGRKGMASTLLVRMKVGYKIVDAKGVSELYKNRIQPSYIAALFVSAMFPILLVARMSPQIQELYRLLALRIKLLLGF